MSRSKQVRCRRGRTCGVCAGLSSHASRETKRRAAQLAAIDDVETALVEHDEWDIDTFDVTDRVAHHDRL